MTTLITKITNFFRRNNNPRPAAAGVTPTADEDHPPSLIAPPQPQALHQLEERNTHTHIGTAGGDPLTGVAQPPNHSTQGPHPIRNNANATSEIVTKKMGTNATLLTVTLIIPIITICIYGITLHCSFFSEAATSFASLTNLTTFTVAVAVFAGLLGLLLAEKNLPTRAGPPSMVAFGGFLLMVSGLTFTAGYKVFHCDVYECLFAAYCVCSFFACFAGNVSLVLTVALCTPPLFLTLLLHLCQV